MIAIFYITIIALLLFQSVLWSNYLKYLEKSHSGFSFILYYNLLFNNFKKKIWERKHYFVQFLANYQTPMLITQVIMLLESEFQILIQPNNILNNFE